MKYALVFSLLLLWMSCQKDDQILPLYPADEINLTSRAAYPDILPLPEDFQPEGIVIGPKHDFYVGSLVTGKIYKGDLRTGKGEVFIAPSGPTQAVGLALDTRSGYLFVAGGFTGTATVYNYNTGVHIKTLSLAMPGSTLINDVTVTRDAAYITDSRNPVLYKIPLSRSGRLRNPSQVIALPLSGDFSIIPNPANPIPLGAYANGIDATPSGKTLILANTDRGEIYLVDPITGTTSVIDLGGTLLFNADGILLNGKYLYVVQNFLNQIAIIKLNDDLYSGSVIKFISDPNFAIPTTIDQFGSNLYVVNAHFGEPPGNREVIKVRK